MANITKPNFSNALWASGGSIVAPSDVKIATGWTAEVPPFQWENYSQNRQDQGIAHILQYGISVWDSLTEYQSGKSYVQGSDGLIYKARQTNTNQNPVTDITFVYWTKAFSGGLLAVRYITATGVYTPTPGTSFVEVELIGGGGAGGGAPVVGAGNVSAAPGGGGGGYARKLITSAFSGVTVTIGAGGVGALGAVGGNGGNTSFGAIFSATGGGGGGAGIIASATAQPVASGIGAGGSGVGGDINASGGIGMYAFISAQPTSGKGGSTQLSEGAAYRGATGNGVNGGINSGAGGSGSAATAGAPATTGGNGGTGLCIIREYA